MEMASTARSDRAQELHGQLVDQVRELVTGEDWAEALRTAARFHRYSFGNVMLITMQRPDATRVAGFNTWKGLGRYVRKGERGITILAPMTFRRREVDPSTGAEVEYRGIRGFRTVHVFDVSQTDGAELAEVRPELLNGDAPAGVWSTAVAMAAEAGFSVDREPIETAANGFCDYSAKRICVRPDVSDAQAAKTIVHELAHALMHGPDVDGLTRDVAEVEAESVAFIVATAAGLDTSTYSLPYVAGWSAGDVDLVQRTGERVMRTARQILDALEGSPAPAYADQAA
jgi:hypothetical protein